MELTQLFLRCLDYEAWKQRYASVYSKFVRSPQLPRVKIAVLDTGLDESHPYVEARIEKIKARYNWMAKTDGDKQRVSDNHGHGTFTASLILEYTPDAELYIAKITADNRPAPPEIIAKASFPPPPPQTLL